MKKVYLSVLLLLFAFCALGQISRDLDIFKKLEVTDKINIQIIPSTFDKIVIEGELADHVELIQVSDVIRLKMSGSYVLQGNKVDIKLYSSELNHITARKGAQVVTFNDIIEVDSLYLSSSEGANVIADIKVNYVKSSSSTGALIVLKGAVKTQDADVSFGGKYECRSLLSEKAIVKVNGGGKAIVDTRVSFDGMIRAGGIIDVYGKPKQVKESKLVGGKINYL